MSLFDTPGKFSSDQVYDIFYSLTFFSVLLWRNYQNKNIMSLIRNIVPYVSDKGIIRNICLFLKLLFGDLLSAGIKHGGEHVLQDCNTNHLQQQTFQDEKICRFSHFAPLSVLDLGSQRGGQ